jgi:RNA recognition motif-containing protein
MICRLYCTNLSDKLRKQDLRLSLYTLFSTYGTVLDVVAVKTEQMRGQAHIVFKDVQASTQAMRALQGFEFFGKPMVYSSNFLALAKTR